ncbi:MAG: amidohydrolase [Clostridia bacterium]|nr:amidohydrolase [Clostridia bacterium]
MSYTIIDSHTHVYPDKIALKAAKSIGQFYDIDMRMNGSISGLLQVMEEEGVSKSLICSAALTADRVPAINNFIAATVEAHPDKFFGLMTLHPDMEDPKAEVERAMEMGLRGVKLHPDMQKFALDDPICHKMYAACENVCPMLLHTGDKRFRYSNPDMIPRVLDRFPGLTLICAHMGGYSEWDAAARCLADTNVYVDCSSTFFAVDKEKVLELFDLYGEDRILFGSDYPMWHVGDEIKTLLSLGLSDTALKKIFSENILRILP